MFKYFWKHCSNTPLYAVKEEDYYKVETYFGKFSRSFTLPDNADIENIEASSENGVLEVIIPKLKDDTTKKTIAIK